MYQYEKSNLKRFLRSRIILCPIVYLTIDWDNNVKEVPCSSLGGVIVTRLTNLSTQLIQQFIQTRHFLQNFLLKEAREYRKILAMHRRFRMKKWAKQVNINVPIRACWLVIMNILSHFIVHQITSRASGKFVWQRLTCVMIFLLKSQCFLFAMLWILSSDSCFWDGKLDFKQSFFLPNSYNWSSFKYKINKIDIISLSC